jgi:hypothetical protein
MAVRHLIRDRAGAWRGNRLLDDTRLRRFGSENRPSLVERCPRLRFAADFRHHNRLMFRFHGRSVDLNVHLHPPRSSGMTAAGSTRFRFFPKAHFNGVLLRRQVGQNARPNGSLSLLDCGLGGKPDACRVRG